MAKPHLPHLYTLSDIESDDDDAATSVTSILSRSAGASSVTSHDRSMRSASPVPSVISMTGSMRENIFKLEYGRGLNNYSEVYRLPADDEEWNRLAKQYPLFTEIMGKYPPPLHQVMEDEGPGGETKRCLDLGCGNGNWIIDLARDFPHCEAVAVDLVPMESLSMPPNLRSEVDDINLGLEHFYGDFNVVHAWLIASGIKDYGQLIDQISRVLRPGGLIDIMEWDFCVHDINKCQVNLPTCQLGPPWWARWLAFAASAIRGRGGDVDAASQLETWVRNHPAFQGVVIREFWLPTSPWNMDDVDMVQKSTILRDDILEFLNSGRPLLLGAGVPLEVVDHLQSNARQELLEARVPEYVRLRRVYARKKH
ncbi:hypothetical protein AX17_000774 [Amanita inopinata Kibby_2008]|nr:hypothetical protein AX17_000774 [Amanita inopinata Kibby_2008]